MSVSKEKLIEWLRVHITDAEAITKAFQTRLQENPALAVARSACVFEAAARLKVFRSIVDAFMSKDSKATPVTIEQYALDRLRYMAESPHNSTSPTANLFYVCELSAWAYLYNAFGLM